jgi:hypothetical protein
MSEGSVIGGAMARVFISFIHEEVDYAEEVQRFITRLSGSAAAPFLSSDKLQIYAGEKWIDRIMDELKDANVVILILSEESVKRPWVNFEAGAAWTRDIAIIPVCIRGLRKDELPKPYSNLQAIELRKYGDDEYLARSVAHYIGVPEPLGRHYGQGMYGLGDEELKSRAALENIEYDFFEERLKFLDELSINYD